MNARAIRLLLAGGFLSAVAHVAPVAERAALGISHGDFVRVEDLAPEAIARPLGKIRAACRLSHRLESPSESGDACGRGEPSSDAHAQPPRILPNPALTPGAVRTTDRDDVCADMPRSAHNAHTDKIPGGCSDNPAEGRVHCPKPACDPAANAKPCSDPREYPES
jgi:hypothetical protein